MDWKSKGAQIASSSVLHPTAGFSIHISWGAPKKSHVTEDGSESTFRGLSEDQSSCFFIEFRTLQPFLGRFLFFFPSGVKSRLSPDNSALSMTSHYCLDGHAMDDQWSPDSFLTAEVISTTVPGGAAADRNSEAANFYCAAGLEQAALRLCARTAGTGRGGKVAWCLRNHDNVLGGHFFFF